MKNVMDNCPASEVELLGMGTDDELGSPCN
jgi:hypothetical protein